MKLLGLDVGSSSVKAGVVRDGRVLSEPVRSTFPTRHDGPCVQVDPRKLLDALVEAIGKVGSAGRSVDAVNFSVMAPAWIAMDSAGKPLTPLVTHQDRRSVEIAKELEARIGKQRHLRLAGNRPFPGGISSTTLAWFLRYEPARLKNADLIGHLNTYLHRQITGARVIDPSNASFTGLYDTVHQGGWSDELCEAVGVSPRLLPDVIESDCIGGKVTKAAARKFGLTAGTPVMVGIIDTSSAMFLAGAAAGQLLNVCGSTDVLGLCSNRAHPNEKLLTRALGIGQKWMSVATLAASGTALAWMKDQFFGDLSWKQFDGLSSKLGKPSVGAQRNTDSGVIFAPYLAGERTSIEQKKGAFTGLTLSTTREDMLFAVIDALAKASAARLPLLRATGTPIHRHVVVSGGAQRGLHNILRRDWPGRWTFKSEEEASLRGLGMMTPRDR